MTAGGAVYVPMKMAKLAKSSHARARVLQTLQYRVEDMEKAKWPALAESWRRDLHAVEAYFAENPLPSR